MAWSVTAVPLGTEMVAPVLPPPLRMPLRVVGTWFPVPVVVVVVGEVPPEVAITGAMELALGVEVVMPEGVTVSLGYAVQVRSSALPATFSVRLAEESSVMVMGPPVALKPLTVAGVDGRVNATPSAGTGDGMVTLKSSGPSGVDAGVAPLASILVLADPLSVGEMAAAALAKAAGRLAVVE